MYCVPLIYLIFGAVFVLPVSTNKSITYREQSTSPDITARVYQEATNLVPPDDEAPPAQPIVPAEPATPSTSSRIMGAIWDLLPGGPCAGSSNLVGVVSQPPEMGSFARWLFGDNSKDECEDSKKKCDSSKRSRDK